MKRHFGCKMSQQENPAGSILRMKDSRLEDLFLSQSDVLLCPAFIISSYIYCITIFTDLLPIFTIVTVPAETFVLIVATPFLLTAEPS